MSNYTEKEVKILNIDDALIEKKLIELGATKEFDVIQNIMTYQFPTTEIRYLNILNQLKTTKCNKMEIIKKLRNLFLELSNVEEGTELNKICEFNNLKELSENICLNDKLLFQENFISYISKLDNNFFKWIRLRTTNDKTTLTLKQIFSTEDEYPIDKLKEVEFEVSDFNATDKFLQELDFVCDSHQEKRRIKYTYKNLEIVIDYWPLLNPYVEIEGQDEDEIYNLVEKLGYRKSDAVVMNTDTVYKLNNINREDYFILTFNKQEKRL